MTKENIQPLHNASVVQGIASEFGEKDIQGENSLHTSPDGSTIPALCKVGATGELGKNIKVIQDGNGYSCKITREYTLQDIHRKINDYEKREKTLSYNDKEEYDVLCKILFIDNYRR